MSDGYSSVLYDHFDPILRCDKGSAGFSAVTGSILASVGLEAIGLGPMADPTMGMTLYWAISFTAMLAGMWWWWLPPIIVIMIIFSGLYLIAAGLDKIANPWLEGPLA